MGRTDRDDATHGEHARCPRCGYDLRGTVTTWTTECPLEGTCTECGLAIRWAEVLRPEKFEPRWCVEFVPRKRGVPLAAMRTFVRSFWPWGFWSRIKMSHRVRWGRLAAYVAALVAPWLLLYVVVQGGAAVYVRWILEQEVRQQAVQAPQMIQWYQSEREQVVAGTGDYAELVRFEDYRQQLLRDYDTAIAQLQSIVQSKPYVDHSYLEAVVEALVFPLRTSSWGSIRTETRWINAYPSPTDVRFHSLMALEELGIVVLDPWRPWEQLLEQYFEMGFWVGLGLGAMLLLPLTFILLPVSRRRSKVQWRHLGRVFAYGLFIPSALVVIGMVGTAVLAILGLGSWEWWLHMLGWYGLPVLVIAWWTAAISRHLRMRHALAVATLHTALAGLLALALAWPWALPLLVEGF